MVDHLSRLLDRATLVPAVNQIEVHSYFAQREVQDFGAGHGILTQAWPTRRVLDTDVIRTDPWGRSPPTHWYRLD
jgi:diketogulonate reductase-like aldo/keto reductase